ncbi:hypothetical protein AXG93_93s1500 [Marchantia polymorpha subsp. ruderalis]|uniref:Uncharacterized protein n=1 Tax=Marchantia polymorpha subsp. ruderalis TaxID=1480154 RepID=A0A176WTU6_MARPO|nr:hypothetical protein AXG93_93s1500 [Marchantia polymorpha subsp. ruderalis]
MAGRQAIHPLLDSGAGAGEDEARGMAKDEPPPAAADQQGANGSDTGEAGSPLLSRFHETNPTPTQPKLTLTRLMIVEEPW